MHARLVLGSAMIYHRSRLEHKQAPRVCAFAAADLHFDEKALINSAES